MRRKRNRAMKRRDFLRMGARAAASALVASAGTGEAFADDTVFVTIRGARMVPDRLTVKKGQPIAIADKDNTHHAIYSETPGMELQCPINPGGTGVIKFETPGTVTIECAEHPTEIGIIAVI
jgi:plastocyanin